MAQPKEIVPGLFHWTAPAIHIPVSSYYLVRERVLIDPMLPSPDGLEWLQEHGPPEHILLNNRLHARHAAFIVEAFGSAVWCHRAGLGGLVPQLNAQPFEPGDALPGGALAIEIGVLCPEESALLLPGLRAAAVADGVIRYGDGPLGFVPDGMIRETREEVPEIKRGLKAAYRRLVEENFEHLLLAHGAPWLDDGRDALRSWASTVD